jgi:hypothetical protein
MKTYKKIYIGKGKQVANLDIVKISLKLSLLAELAHKYEGEDYITFEVARLQNEDNFGHTHTAYVNKQVEAEEPSTVQEPKASKKVRKSKKTDAKQDNLPF